MKWEEIYDQTKYAFQNGEMSELLAGKGNYHLPIYGAPISVPTDWTSVISKGIFKLYEDEQDKRLVEVYENTIRKLINGSSLEIWIAANIIAYHLRCEVNKKATFEINKEMIDELSKAVHKNKNVLAADKSYQGKDNKYGLLDDILRLNNVLFRNCNIEIIKDE